MTAATTYRPCPDGCGSWDHDPTPAAWDPRECQGCGLTLAACRASRADHLTADTR